MRLLLFLSTLMLMACTLSGCGLFKKKKETVPETLRVIGRVEMVNPEQNYVLVRMDAVQTFAAGSLLVAQDAGGREAKLKVSPERKGRFLTADIVEGQPQVGNVVIWRRADGPVVPAAATAAAPGAAAVPGTGNAPAMAPIPLEPPATGMPLLPGAAALDPALNTTLYQSGGFPVQTEPAAPLPSQP